MSTKTYNLVGIQNLLADTLTTQDISQVASDLFQPLYQKFTAKMTKPQKIEVVVDYAYRNGRITELLEHIERDNRYQYDNDTQERLNRLKSPISTLNFHSNAPYGLEEGFTGRSQELTMLNDWLRTSNGPPLFTLVGEGGIGKSALAWHWQLLTRAYYALFTEAVIWWDCYQPNASIRQFLRSTLTFLRDDPEAYPNPQAQVEQLFTHLRSKSILIIFDGFEQWLRAYQGLDINPTPNYSDKATHAQFCTDPITAGLLTEMVNLQAKSRLLLTSRILPRELLSVDNTLIQGAQQHTLTGLEADDVFRFFSRIDLKTMWGEVQTVCQPLGYHPLTLRLLAGYVIDAKDAPNDLTAAAHYNRQADLAQRQAEIISQAYNYLPDIAQELLAYITAFRGRVERNTIKAIFDNVIKSNKLAEKPSVTEAVTETAKRSWTQIFGGGNKSESSKPAPKKPTIKKPTTLRSTLALLQRRGFIQWTRHENDDSIITTYDAHPNIRRYVYEQQIDTISTVHRVIANYYKATPQPIIVKSLSDLAPTVEWYYHLTRAGRFDEAFDIFQDRLHELMERQLDKYQYALMSLLNALFPQGETHPPQLRDPQARGWVIDTLAQLYSMSGQPAAAIQLYQMDVINLENSGEKTLLAAAVGNLADNQIQTGQLAEAAKNCQRSLDLYAQVETRYKKIAGHWYYGRLLTVQGQWAQAKVQLGAALGLALAEKAEQSQCVTWAYRAHLALLQEQADEALNAAQKSLNIATERKNDRDRTRAHWLLGWANLLNNEHIEAQTHLDAALKRSRKATLTEFEPAILLALAKLARAQGNGKQAHHHIETARRMAFRAGYVLDLADIYNFLARLALDIGDYPTAAQHAEQAHQFARCDGDPHIYQAALDKAERLLGMLSYQL